MVGRNRIRLVRRAVLRMVLGLGEFRPCRVVRRTDKLQMPFAFDRSPSAIVDIAPRYARRQKDSAPEVCPIQCAKALASTERGSILEFRTVCGRADRF
jgi:hypothetical protein